ncbi:MAG TPA: IS630 family transposase [Verrucomicrobiae bacterium]|nr:IS630 family transposase [Verrucomicrobiae bacterium]
MKVDGRTLDHKTLEHLRITAVRRVVEDGEAPGEVMRSMGLCRSSIYPWLRRYQDNGLAALAEKIAQGREPKLTDKQQQQVKRWIVGRDPRQYGFDYGLWTRRIVQSLIERKFGIRLGWTAVGRLLARLEITPQKPLRRAYERDPESIQRWLDEDYPKLRRRAKKHGAKIYFLDEAGFHSDPVLGRTYGLKGHTPVVATSGQRQSINAISAVNAKGEFWYNVYTGKLNAARFVEFLQDLMKGRRERVFLVVDGHPSHKAKLVQACVKSFASKLELHFLPPYAPDLNPDEFVWGYAKTNGVSKKPLQQNESLKERVISDLEAIRRNRNLVKSFFCAKSVVYARDW